MQKVYIVRCGESALKGKNKPFFERMLVQRIKKKISDLGDIEVERADGLIMVRAGKEIPQSEIVKRVGRVFGVDSLSPALEIPIDGMDAEEVMQLIGELAVDVMNGIISRRDIKTFKVEAKRSDKSFELQSPQIARIVGASVLKACKVLSVDVHDPDCRLYVSVRRGFAYIYEEKFPGFGGLPLGSNGRGMVLLSGGIDSPVAAFLMSHRGMNIDAVHFHSYPYTSERAFEKVKHLAEILSDYCGRIKLFSVNLLPIQEQIIQNCPEEEMTIHMRRFMMKIAETLAEKNDAMMLVTGESLGQVASQTAESLVVTDAAVNMPVMRPLIAMDKVRIMEIAEEIGTFETSILPYEDSCSVFLPKRPVTKPKLARILESESRLEAEKLVQEAVDSAEITLISRASDK